MITEFPPQAEEFIKVDKLWKILEIALKDFRKVEKDKNYVIDMDFWYHPSVATPTICFICLAGSVIANKLLPENQKPQTCYPQDFGGFINLKLQDIDHLRKGKVSSCVSTNSDISARLNREIIKYEESKELWWEQMNQLLEDLKEENI